MQAALQKLELSRKAGLRTAGQSTRAANHDQRYFDFLMASCRTESLVSYPDLISGHSRGQNAKTM